MPNTDRAPDGYIETADPETGALDLMAVWLPPGETADTLGLATFVAAEDIEGETHEDCP